VLMSIHAVSAGTIAGVTAGSRYYASACKPKFVWVVAEFPYFGNLSRIGTTVNKNVKKPHDSKDIFAKMKLALAQIRPRSCSICSFLNSLWKQRELESTGDYYNCISPCRRFFGC